MNSSTITLVEVMQESRHTTRVKEKKRLMSNSSGQEGKTGKLVVRVFKGHREKCTRIESYITSQVL